MKRSVVLLVACACGGAAAQQETAVVVPPASSAPALVVDPATQATATMRSRFELAIDSNFVCVRIDGRVHCAPGFEPGASIASTPPIGGIEDATSLTAGRRFACLARATGEVRCWGANERGQLGARSRDDVSEAPLAVVGVADARRVVAGALHTCAILGDESVKCWGDNTNGQTSGDVVYTEAAHELVEAVLVRGVSGVQLLASDATTTCTLARDRAVTCWGLGHFGPDSSYRGATDEGARRVEALSGFEDLSGAHTAFCGIKEREVYCWGESYSLLGDFRGRAKSPIALAVKGSARRVRVGESHACALLDDGRVSCWGTNAAGALGRATSGEAWSTHPPGIVEGLPRVVDVYAGGTMACALTATRELFCWGRWTLATGEERKEATPVAVRID